MNEWMNEWREWIRVTEWMKRTNKMNEIKKLNELMNKCKERKEQK